MLRILSCILLVRVYPEDRTSLSHGVVAEYSFPSCVHCCMVLAEPLYDDVLQGPTPALRRACKRIFRSFDTEGQGYLSPKQLAFLQNQVRGVHPIDQL